VPLRRPPSAYVVFGQPPSTGTPSAGGGLFSGLPGALKDIGIVVIVLLGAGALFVAAEAARPIIADVEAAEEAHRREAAFHGGGRRR
jgi:hypothetical protein